MYTYWEFVGIMFFSQTKYISLCSLAVRKNIVVRPIVKN